MQVLGLDVGATGIKGAMVDTNKGELISDRIKYPTPKPAFPEAMIDVMHQIAMDFDQLGKPVGIGFPAIIRKGVPYSAANIDNSWIGYPMKSKLTEKLATEEIVIRNDADVAGIAEMSFGAGKDVEGTVIMVTIGTGIGTGIFLDGQLLPNTELGHLKYKKSVFENYMSNRARETKKMGWKTWGKELNLYLNHINFLFSPDLIILGGGVSKQYDKWSKYLNVPTEVVPATMRNNAGIIGAAMMIHKHMR